MGTFKNTMGIRHIHMDKSVKCFCPLGQSWCTYELSIHLQPGEVIPDYLDVEQFLEVEINGGTMTLEDTAGKVLAFFVDTYAPKGASVDVSCSDAKHMPVTVTVEYDRCEE